ncbi:efflux RND transporter periplasmic adaptor subunit [Formosa sp. 4Alg 33]|uniref:efflux RND transporter periplasmic adaptor subunit n=1 Tax=Formosa sp. 4Alg 33 TaxID=3382189 RepID=UPI003D9C1561
MKTQHIIITIGLFSFFLFSCEKKEKIAEKPDKVQHCLGKETLQKLEFTQPSLSAVVEGIPLTGAVEANPDKVVNFVSLVSGVISKTYFSLGDKVTKGQVLAELRSTELSALKAELKNLDSQILVARKNYEAKQSMFKDEVASQREVLEAQSDLNIHIANKDRVESNLNLFSASSEKGVFQIKAPASGYVTSKEIATGTQISTEGEPLFTISDLSNVWVMVNIYATNVKNIQNGMEMDIKTLSYPDKIFKGKVTAITHVFDSEAKVLKARIVISNKDIALKPGMLVDVMALNNKNTQAFSIPTSSLIFDNNENFVVVYKDDCNQEIRNVKTLNSSNGTTFIDNGLNENDKIVSENQILVYEQIKNFQN